MDDVECVARAMAKADGKDPDGAAWVSYPGGNVYGVCWKDQYAAKAEKIIDAYEENKRFNMDCAALSAEVVDH